MLRKSILIVICLIFCFSLSAAERVLIRIPHAGPELYQQHLQQNADIAAFHAGQYLDMVWPIAELEELRSIHPQLIIRSTEAQMKANLGMRDIPGYRDYQDMLDDISMFEALYPDLVQIEVIGAGWGKDYAQQGLPNYQGFQHDIHAIKVSANVSEDLDKPAFYFIGTHHAREPISMEVCVAILEHLTEGYGIDPDITHILDSSQVWIVPLLNPDGHKLVIDQTDIWWRKNIRDNNNNGNIDTASWGNGYDGVDLNRNYSHGWGNISASDDPLSVTYHGLNPFSEPETSALKTLLESKRFLAGVSYHTYGEWVLYPYGYGHNLYAPDVTELSQLAINMAASIPKVGNGTYTPSPSFGLYPVSGSFDDWSYGTRGTFSYTIEMADQFIPPASQVPVIIQNHLTAAKILLQRKDSKTLRGHVSDAETGAALSATIFVEGIDGHYLPRAPYVSDEIFGAYWRFLPVGTYTVRISAEGYLAQSHVVEINSIDQTILDVALEAAPTINQSIRTVDDIGSPLANATIRIAGHAPYFSDDEGYIMVMNIPAGDYSIHISLPGYTSIHSNVSLLGNELIFSLTANPLLMDGFELGMGNWTSSGSWGISNAHSYSGLNSLSDSPSGNYSNETSSFCRSTNIFNLGGYQKVNLQFMAKIDFMNDGDHCVVGYTPAGSSNWQTIDVLQGTHDWTQYDYDLSFLAGQNIHIYFRVITGSSGTADGIYIDDLRLFASVSYVPNEDHVAPAIKLSYGPNPFTQELSIRLDKQDSQAFSIDIFNLRGQKIRSFTNKSLTSNGESFSWDAKDYAGREVSGGIYFLRVSSADGTKISRKVLKLK